MNYQIQGGGGAKALSDGMHVRNSNCSHSVVVETPVVSKPSLLTRLKNAFTPAKTPLTGRQAPHMQTPALNDLSTPSYRSSKKRKRECHGDENFDLSVHTPCIQASGDIELTDFTVSMDTPPNKLFVGSPRSSMFPLERLTPLIESNGSPRFQSPLCQSPRRSIRIAKRRSTCQQVASPRHLPSASVLSPVGAYTCSSIANPYTLFHYFLHSQLLILFFSSCLCVRCKTTC